MTTGHGRMTDPTVDALAAALHKASAYISPAGHGGPARTMHRTVLVKPDVILRALADAGYVVVRAEDMRAPMPGDEGRLYNPINDTGRRNTDRLHCGHWMGGVEACIRPQHQDAEGRDDGTPHRAPSRRDDSRAARLAKETP